MKRTIFLFALTLAIVSAAAFDSLSNVKHIYITPMANGLDQYIANRLTRA